jgi:hypothetical protein
MADDRNRRDAAGVGPYARERGQLVSMSSLGNWKIAKGEPDIRGWEIRTVSGRQLGKVADLLVDREAGEAVMIDVDLPGTDRRAQVPLRVAHIDRATRVVLMDSAEFTGLEESTLDLPPVETARAMTPSSEVVVDRRPIVEETVVRRRDPERRDDIGYSAAGPEAQIERRQGERRRIDRMGTDI